MNLNPSELRRQIEEAIGYSSINCAWHKIERCENEEEYKTAVVGHIDEDGNEYPIAEIDCEQYFDGDSSIKLANFYAAFNPAIALELLDRLEAAVSELETERLRLAAVGTAALGYFDGCKDEYRSASLDDVLRLRERLEAAERDAARYRWLRRDRLCNEMKEVYDIFDDTCEEYMDDAIDAAIAREKDES